MANIDQQDNSYKPDDRYSRSITGLFFVIIGIVLFIHKANMVFMPEWIFTWPMILIVIGIYTGVKHRFENFGWLVMVTIGTIFLINNEFVNFNLQQYTLPVVFVAVGLLFITRPKSRYRNHWHEKRRMFREDMKDWKKKDWMSNENFGAAGYESESINHGDAEYIEMNAVFGGGKRVVFSKNFKGGEINCFMGGAEIDLTQADIQGPVIIEANNVFGGTKLIVPPHWDVKTQITSVFGGVEDKRPPVTTNIDTTKVLILNGTSVFGGIEIKSY